MNEEKWNKSLVKAAFHGNSIKVQLLLQVGADVNYGRGAALRNSVYNGHTKIVKMLLQAGSNIHADNEVALLWAIEADREKSDRAEIVQVLLQGGACSGKTTSAKIKKFLTPNFIVSSQENAISEIEKFHPELGKKYQWSRNKRVLKFVRGETSFDVKISLADLHYRPGEPAYYRAVSLFY